MRFVATIPSVRSRESVSGTTSALFERKTDMNFADEYDPDEDDYTEDDHSEDEPDPADGGEWA